MVLAISTHAGFTLFKITVCIMVMLANVMTITVGKSVMLIVENILLVKVR